MEKAIVVNIAHGNEPFILGTNIAVAVNRILREHNPYRIIVPLIYGERQENILKEEVGEDFKEIILDKKYGEILNKITFKNADYSRHLEDILENNDSVQRDVQQHLRREYRNIGLEINTSSRVLAGPEKVYYAYPNLLSELLEAASLEGLGFKEENLERVIGHAKDMQSRYTRIFLPELNTFSYRERKPLPNEVTVPPLKYRKEDNQEIRNDGIYVVLSGTGSLVDEVKDAAKRTAEQRGLSVYFPPWVDRENGLNPSAIFNPKILAVVARAGYGTLWNCELAGKPIITIPYAANDDPEIYFNIKTIQKQGPGVVYAGQRDIVGEALKVKLPEIKYKKSGLEVCAEEICKDLFS